MLGANTSSRSSLILATRDRPRLVMDAIESILDGTMLPTELLVIDQSRSPNPDVQRLASERAPECCVRYIWTRTRGLSRANNLGVRAARYPLLAFTHDDVVADSGWYGSLMSALISAGPRAVITGQVRPLQNGSGGFVPTLKVDSRPRVYSGRIDEDVLYPLNMAMYRSAIEEIGGFDERLGPGTPFPAAEDNDLGLRLLRAGYAIHYAPEPVVYHRDWRSNDQLVHLRWSYGRGQGAYYTKYVKPGDRHMLGRMVYDVRRHIWQGLCRARRTPRLARGDAAYTLGIIVGSVQWLLLSHK